MKTSWRCLEDVLKTSWSFLEDILGRRLEDVLKTSWRCLKDVLKTPWRCMAKTKLLVMTKTFSEDVWLRRIYSSLSRRHEDVFWRRRRKTSSRRLHQDEYLLGTYFAKGGRISGRISVLSLNEIDVKPRTTTIFGNFSNNS